MKNLHWAVVAALLMTGPACTKKEPVPEAGSTGKSVLLTPGKILDKTEVSDLPFNLYRFMSADPKNICLSPLSLEQAFSMVYLGSNGKTKSLVEEIFGFKNNEVYSLKSETFNKAISFEWGNSIWVKPGKTLSPSFIEATKEKLEASYTASLELSKINGWIAKTTHDKIKNLIKHLDLNTLTVLVNAFYLNAPWEKPFEKSANLFGPFQSSPHMASQVTYMGRKDNTLYFENGFSKWIELPYADRSISMLIAIPKMKYGLKTIEDSLSAKRLDEVAAGLRSEFVDIRIPKFTMETSLSLSSIFESMGYGELFKKGDFSRMTILPDVKISEIMQATYVKVDERGTEAAATTAVMVKAGAAPLLEEPKTFYANEPFVFIIRNKTTGKIYFIGRVYEPKS